MIAGSVILDWEVQPRRRDMQGTCVYHTLRHDLGGSPRSNRMRRGSEGLLVHRHILYAAIYDVLVSGHDIVPWCGGSAHSVPAHLAMPEWAKELDYR